MVMQAAQKSAGWIAELSLGYAHRQHKTCLLHKRQLGPLTVQRPFYPEGAVCHSYILHPPGGIVGGDQLSIDVVCDEQATALITTPGATKFYRSGGENLAYQNQRLQVNAGATLEWLPQQNIFFPGARAQLDTEVHIQPGGKYIGWEMHCFGRPVIDEPFSHGEVRASTRIWLNGELRLVEQLFTEADQLIQSPTGLRGQPLQGSLIAAPCDAALALQLREFVDSLVDGQSHTSGQALPVIGLTLVDEVLVVRMLGEQAEVMFGIFARIWSQLRPAMLGVSPCAPRIWAT